MYVCVCLYIYTYIYMYKIDWQGFRNQAYSLGSRVPKDASVGPSWLWKSATGSVFGIYLEDHGT